MQNLKYLIFGLFIVVSSNSFSQTTLVTPNIESVLYLGNGKNQPLIVGIGGSEGGNAWTSDYWKKTRHSASASSSGKLIKRSFNNYRFYNFPVAFLLQGFY